MENHSYDIFVDDKNLSFEKDWSKKILKKIKKKYENFSNRRKWVYRSHLYEKLVKDGHKVTVIDNFCIGRKSILKILKIKLKSIKEILEIMIVLNIFSKN